jgi:C1A family cysteine protease
LNNNENFDSGATIKEGLKIIHKLGTCKENLCKYDVSKYTKKPSASAYENAKFHKIAKYFSVNTTVNEFKTALSLGYPIVFGFMVKSSFENVDNTGILKYDPAEPENGGHAVLCCGYNDDINGIGYIKVMNSWGPNWGDNGYFYMPYEYLESGLCSDAWIIVKISNNQ